MNLYVWSGEGVLPHYGNGCCIAYASSIEKARELVRAKLLDRYNYIDPDDEWMVDRLKFLQDEPMDYSDTEVAYCIEGSE